MNKKKLKNIVIPVIATSINTLISYKILKSLKKSSKKSLKKSSKKSLKKSFKKSPKKKEILYSTTEKIPLEFKINNEYDNKKNVFKPKHNYEDRIDILKKKNNYILFGIYDGHGMGLYDETNFVVDYVKENLLKTIANYDIIDENKIKDSFNKIGNELKEICKTKNCNYLGCTATVVCIQGKNIFVAWIGDSPCYGIKDRILKKLVEEHDYNNKKEIKRICKNNWKDERVGGLLAVSRAFGDLGIKGIIFEPDIEKYDLNNFDKILICSDGVYDSLTTGYTNDIENMFLFSKAIIELSKNTSTDEVIKKLINKINNFLKIEYEENMENYYRDDISAIFIKF